MNCCCLKSTDHLLVQVNIQNICLNLRFGGLGAGVYSSIHESHGLISGSKASACQPGGRHGRLLRSWRAAHVCLWHSRQLLVLYLLRALSYSNIKQEDSGIILHHCLEWNYIAFFHIWSQTWPLTQLTAGKGSNM